VTYLGSRLQTVSLTDWRLWALVAGLLALLFLAHRLVPAPAGPERPSGASTLRGSDCLPRR